MNVVSIWENLNAGEIMTNGEVEVHYKDGMLHGAEVIPFNADNAEDWFVKLPEVDPSILYHRAVYDNDGALKFSRGFYKPSHKLARGWKLFGEGYTKEQLMEG